MLSFLQIALIMGSLARGPQKGCPPGSADSSPQEWPRLCWPEVDALSPHPQRGFWHLTSRLGVASTATKTNLERSTTVPRALGSAPWRALHPAPEERTHETRGAPLCLLCCRLFLLYELFFCFLAFGFGFWILDFFF